jgi:hypothetical protein
VAAVVAALERRGADELRQVGADARLAEGYELATPAHMTVTGVQRWLRKRNG